MGHTLSAFLFGLLLSGDFENMGAAKFRLYLVCLGVTFWGLVVVCQGEKSQNVVGGLIDGGVHIEGKKSSVIAWKSRRRLSSSSAVRK